MWGRWFTKTIDGAAAAGALSGGDRVPVAQGFSSTIVRTTLSAIATKVGSLLGLGTMATQNATNVGISGGTISGVTVADPTLSGHIANKHYVDALALGVAKRGNVRAASTANINLAAPGAAIDGVAMVAGDPFLAKDETAAATNGVYLWNGAAVAATRAPQYDTFNEIAGALIVVEEGGTNADTMWLCTSNEGGTLETTAISFTRIRIELTDPVTIAQGGTGQTTAAAAFDALSPNTTRGDLTVRGASGNIRLAVGAANRVMRSNGTDPAWGQVDLTADVVNALAAANGGTGIASYAIGDLLYASGLTALSKLADVATGNALLSGGVGVAPAWGKIGLTTHVSGTLGIANGGTGQTTAAAAFDALSPNTTRGDLAVRGAAGNIRLAIGAANRVLRSDGTDPAWGQVALATDISGLAAGAATFLATPSSANLASLLTDETGTGANVHANAPTLDSATSTTQFTSPKHLGGTGTGSSLVLQSTSGAGATDFIDVLLGNNGATRAFRAINSGSVGFNMTTPQSIVGIKVSSSDGNVGANWGSGFSGLTIGTGADSATGEAIGICNDSAAHVGYIVCLTPGVAWRDLAIRAASFTVYVGGTTQAFKADTSRLTASLPIKQKSYTVATLPAGQAGDTAYATDCRAFNGAGVQEGAAAGTGAMVNSNGTAWKIAGTNVTAVA